MESAAAALDARLVPKTEINSPGVTPVGARPKLAPLTTAPGATTGCCDQAAETKTADTRKAENDFKENPPEIILGDDKSLRKAGIREFTGVRKRLPAYPAACASRHRNFSHGLTLASCWPTVPMRFLVAYEVDVGFSRNESLDSVIGHFEVELIDHLEVQLCSCSPHLMVNAKDGLRAAIFLQQEVTLGQILLGICRSCRE